MKFSTEQVAVFAHIFNVAKNLVINALAGTGKTYTIIMACIQFAAKFGGKWGDMLFLAFNRSIANEIAGKPVFMTDADCHFMVDENGEMIKDGRNVRAIAQVDTCHSFGLYCLNRYLRKIGSNVQFNRDNKNIDNNKYYEYAKTLVVVGDRSKSEVNEVARKASQLFNLARINLLGTKEQIKALVAHHDMQTTDEVINICLAMLKVGYDLNWTMAMAKPTIDFTDMLCLPFSQHVKIMRATGDERQAIIPWYKLVFADECQDLSRLQREIMRTAARHGRFVAVGDPNQAINGFAGADCDSFWEIAKVHNTDMLPLSVNYRCGKKIINVAQTIVPEIKACENACDGIVRTIFDVDADTFKEGVPFENVDKETGEITTDYTDGDMILCRCSAPLVTLGLKLVASGKTAIVLGKDIASSIKGFIKDSDTKTIKGFKTWAEQRKTKLIAEICKDKDCTPSEALSAPEYVTFMDKVNCVLAFEGETSSLSEIGKRLDDMFSEDRKKGAITLCTCHKSKGLECDRVFVLSPEKLPLVWKGQLDWQYQQEENLKYVTITRAKKELVWVSMDIDKLLAADLKTK